MTSSSLLRGLIKVFRCNSGKMDSRMRIQKSVYLLQQLGDEDLKRFRFSYYHYGPFSRELSNTLHDAVSHGILDETSEDYSGEITRYSYNLTGIGAEVAEQLGLEDDARNANVLHILSKYNLPTLELASTVLFLSRTNAVSNTNDALKRALELKPHCSNEQQNAMELLNSLKLA